MAALLGVCGQTANQSQQENQEEGFLKKLERYEAVAHFSCLPLVNRNIPVRRAEYDNRHRRLVGVIFFLFLPRTIWLL